jgi:hypothetical protein
VYLYNLKKEELKRCPVCAMRYDKPYQIAKPEWEVCHSSSAMFLLRSKHLRMCALKRLICWWKGHILADVDYGLLEGVGFRAVECVRCSERFAIRRYRKVYTPINAYTLLSWVNIQGDVITREKISNKIIEMHDEFERGER